MKQFLYLFLLMTVAIVAACTSSEKSTVGSSTEHRVYAAGAMIDSLGVQRATLWVNGVATYLCDSSSTATALFVTDGGDVYVAGGVVEGENEDMRSWAMLWKNGHGTRLFADESLATALWVADGRVYVTGYRLRDDNPESFLWMSGAIRNAGEEGALPQSVVARDNEIYIGYNGYTYDGQPVASVWQNDESLYIFPDAQFAAVQVK
ncbi:MAG: hypothetical protein LBM61_05500 [Prevotellaceae bacterium]|jgi:hypothetical protein|nr:hypothetical protein [Prevotellaceae bacterium]